MRKFISAFVLSLLGLGSIYGQSDRKELNNQQSINVTMDKSIYFAGGCFWGTEHFMKQIQGVKETEVGYANSKPTWTGKTVSYKEVCSGMTGLAETVKVVYDPDKVNLRFLVELFFKTIDPTSLNRQGNDRGTQYRTGIYYQDETDGLLLKQMVKELAKNYSKPLVIEILPLRNYFAAEDFHQDYLENNPQGYCHISADLFELAKHANVKTHSDAKKSSLTNANVKGTETKTYVKMDEANLRKHLSKLQYAVTQENKTEHPFENEYWDESREGIYVDITSGEPLFVSTDKFESGCGWPSFSRPISKDLIVEKKDLSFGMIRVEVRSKTSDSHLGHVFTDGPEELGGLRYCINSASLRFIPKRDMLKEGYGDYLPLLEPK